MKVINSFTLDTKNIREGGEARALSVSGENGARFSLEIKSGSNYYNFQTNLFQANKTRLSNVLIGDDIIDINVRFPTVSAGAKYDIYLTAEGDTEHADYKEVRFPDGSMDINSTTGSNSRLVQKVIYQTLDVTVTINGYSPNGTVTGTSTTSATVSASREKSTVKIPFTHKFTVASTRTLSINRQPISSDIMAFVAATVGSPVDIPGENIHPTATAAFTGDDINGAITSGSVVRMDNTDLSAVIQVGDKITTATTTSEVVGSVTGINVNMATAVATIMAVGDQVTCPTLEFEGTNPNNTLVTVAALNVGGDTAVFALSEALVLDHEAVLIFSSKINRSPTTVTVVETSSTATDFTMSQAIQFRDNAPLTFFNQRNYRWEIFSTSIDLSKLALGMRQVQATFFAAQPTIKDYVDEVVIFEGERKQQAIEKVRIPGVDTRSIRPLIVRDGTTKVVTTTTGSSTNPINITFDQQALLTFGGGANAKVFSYGEPDINRLTGYDVEFSDLAVSLAGVSTTTTAAVSASTSVPITQRAGIMDGISSVSGIGIDASAVNPTVASGAGSVTGAGTIVLSAAQTLEDGITLTFPGAGTVATITGNIKINHVGNEDVVLRFDLEKFLTMH